MANSLAQLTDAYDQPETIDGLPVESVPIDTDGVRRVRINTSKSEPDPALSDFNTSVGTKLDDILNKLTGANGQQRYQLWPEKIIREGLSAAGDVMNEGTVNPGLRREDVTDIPKPDMPTKDSTWLGKLLKLAPVAAQPGDTLIEKAQAISALAGTGGLAGGAEGAVLNATPSLRPALRYKDKLYKGKPDQQHMDIIPKELYPEFERMAMSGEDISHYNFGFVNDKGHFLDREKALEYGINNGLIDPHACKYGALTSTLMADSSKPGTAIEAMAKTQPLKIYRGEYGGNKGGKFWTEDSEFARQFTQSGQMHEILKRHIDDAHIYKPKEKIYAGDPDAVDKVVAEAKAKGFKAVQLDEGANQPNSIYIFDKKALLKADNEAAVALQATKTASPFFSALEHNVSQISQSKMTGDQWLGTLSNKPGVKPEELQWTGLGEFLKENASKSVTKAQIEEHLANNKVELKEVNKYDDKSSMSREAWDNLPDAEQRRILDGNVEPTKYHSYQLPGGENYREMLLTLPKKSDADFLKAYQSHTGVDVSNLKPEQIVNLRRNTEGKFGNDYKSSHWDEPNILAHVRMNDRTIDGKKSLHLEEIQSDWHQQGRDKGYKLSDKEKARADEIITQGDKVGGVHNLPQAIQDEAKALSTRMVSDAPPDAPFKKSWHELALKRMIREVAEKGYDRLSWTPGEAQAARYDLSKDIKTLQYIKHKDGTFGIDGETTKGGMHNFGNNISENKLSDYVGKEIASKILKDKNAIGKLENADLKIGGEGMKGFYDKMIPAAIEKIGKEHGVKVKQTIDHNAGEKFAYMNKASGNKGKEFKSQEEAKAWLKESGINPDSVTLLQVNRHAKEGSKFEPIHYIDIPQSLKDQAMHKGFPLFSKGGHMLMPVDHEPDFGDKK